MSNFEYINMLSEQDTEYLRMLTEQDTDEDHMSIEQDHDGDNLLPSIFTKTLNPSKAPQNDVIFEFLSMHLFNLKFNMYS